MRKLPARKLLGAIIAGALFLPDVAFTLGLGEIEVKSALNQKLSADIELLSATPEDTENIIVKLASRKEFLRAGLDRPYLLNDLRFKSEVINDIPHIIVTSGSPIREPFLNFLVEVDWPNGHLLREYTILLDPPVFMTQPASAASAPFNQNASTGFRPDSGSSANVVPVMMPGLSVTSSSRPADTVAPSPVTQAATTPAFMPAPMVQQQTSINQPAGSYRIKTGDTAWSLADAMRPDQSISVEQMMIAMLRSNPESFINENVNGLKRGYILRVPDYNQIAAINQAEARALVREQAALWRQYQQSQAAGQPVSALESEVGSGSAGSDDTAELSTADDAYLEIVSAGSGSSAISGKDPTQMTAQELRAELALARERVETERVEKEALQQRVSALEQHVDSMKGMLSIEDQELAEVQSLSAPDQGELSDMDAGLEALTGEMAASEEAMAELGESAALESEEMVSAGVSEEGAELVEEGVGEEAVFADETAGEEPAQAVAEMPEQVEPAIDDSVAAVPQIDAREPADPLSRLLNDPMLLAAAGGGLLLIVALIGLIIKRRKDASETAEPETAGAAVDLESLADDIAAETEEVAAEEVVAESPAGEQAAAEAEFDSDATMVMNAAEDTVVTEAGAAAVAEEDEPRDDVIAEADVYLAYGIYQQAEELLTQAIADNPDRDDYRLKLAETHYASKNANAFVEVATEIKNRTDSDDSPLWKKVMVMGQDLCADNPMFQGSMVGGLDVDDLAPKAPEMDFDLGVDEPESSADLDLSLGEEESLELPDDTAEKTVGAASDDAAQLLESEESVVQEPVDELEFDLSDTGAVEESAAVEDEFSLDIDASELDIEIEDEAAAVSESSEDSIELDDIDLGLPAEEEKSGDEVLDIGDVDIDFGLDEDEAESAQATAEALETEEEISLDLTDEAESLEMELGEEAETEAEEVELEAETESVAAVSDELSEEEDFDLSSLDDVDEISTKLDLARAYLDMGDNEGSRGILEEVLAEGNDEQKQEASELMAKLD